MPKRKSSIGRSSAAAQRQQRLRHEETPQQQQARQDGNRLCTTQARAQETPQEQEARQERNRQLAAQARSQETPQVQQARQQRNQQRTDQARSQQTLEDQHARQQRNRQHTAQAVNALNVKLLERQPGESRCYKSVDTVCDSEEVVNYPMEFLNSLEPAGLPPHNLLLKQGAPIMLLRNLDPPRLCNGTRLTIKQMMPRVLEATIMTGKAKGENVFIPRIPLIPSDMPFQFKRLQFPVKVSYAMTINKSQGQSLRCVGLNLMEPVFSHGQLYVGCSRVGSPKELYILSQDGKTKNVVYQEALN